MSLLIDALNKADGERRKKLELTLADDEHTVIQNSESQANAQPKITSPKDINSSAENAINNFRAESSGAYIPPNSPSNNLPPIRKSGFHYSLVLLIAFILLIIGAIGWWIGNSPSGLVVNTDNPKGAPNLSSTTQTSQANQLVNDVGINSQSDFQNSASGNISSNNENNQSNSAQIKLSQNNNISNLPELQVTSQNNQSPQLRQTEFSNRADFNSQIIEKNGRQINLPQGLQQNNDSPAPKLPIPESASPKPSQELVVCTPAMPVEPKPRKRTSTNTKALIKPPVSEAVISNSSTDMNLAASYLSRQNYIGASEIYSEVLKRNPNNIEALQNMGVIAYNQGNLEQSRVWFDKVLRLRPNHRFARNVLTAMDNDNSGAVIDNTLDYNPAQRFYIQGNSFAEKAQWSAALNNYSQALNIDGANPDYAYNLAVACDQLGQYECALQNYQKALMNNRSFRANFTPAIVRSRISEILGIEEQSSIIK